ncbi:hypothetical protein AU255_00775 [Methyloprofundus sedimenti]|uniref:type I site-specific deoxyribonuclease n=1 Tax=Methyloprofundus sedimenti TaxID=1420851 RepID=A0A1V8M4K3_9GAMM|nr:type I restriction endonuclease [Methyloprofundus sedimenti]OQK16474.1 hypothetical protein AU255_00775 [Methyloprofundus sedimenti]
MSYEYSEDGLVEAAAQEVLEDLGWIVEYAWAREGLSPVDDKLRKKGLLGRINKSEVLLVRYLLAALQELNPNLPATAYQQAVDLLNGTIADKHLAAINKEKYHYLVNGVPVSFQDEKGVLQKKLLQVINFAEPVKNDFRAVRQFEVVGKLYNRRPDIVGFVNGIPLVFFELKAHHTDLRHAFDDILCTYKADIPEILQCNGFIILSNGTDARVGTVTSPYKFFLEWKRINEDDAGLVSLDTLLRGTCDKTRLLDLFENLAKEEAEVKKVAKKTLESLKAEKLKIDRWRESEQVSSQVKVMISDALEYLPPEPYPDDELADMSLAVYQHVYSHYQGGGASSYDVI